MTIDRSFAAQPPPCLVTLTAQTDRGETLGGATVTLATATKIRQDCLAEVAAWIEGERAARSRGAPGA